VLDDRHGGGRRELGDQLEGGVGVVDVVVGQLLALQLLGLVATPGDAGRWER
jgi:hypothetical protein